MMEGLISPTRRGGRAAGFTVIFLKGVMADDCGER
nr:MAG TPA: hypothetical protein [Caudoviricetes sp.]